MDEIWERAMDTALDGQTDIASVRTLTLDGAVKCFHGRLPPPPIFEKFHNLQHLSIANIGLSSLEQFPRLRNLQKLILSDNRIAGGLEFLVEAGLESLRDLDLSNNRISDIDVLRPLAELRLVSLDLYECPVTRVKDYRSLVFNMISSLKYLDKMDAEENERPESDDEEEDEEEEEEDPGSGEVDGDEHPLRVLSNGHLAGGGGVVDVDEDTESDADEEVAETSRGVSGLSKSGESHNHSNGFPENVVDGEDDEGEDDDDSEDEIYEDDDEGDDEDVVEVHEIDDDSDDEEDGVEDDDEDEDEEVDNDERDIKEPESTGRLTSTEGEIDAHEQGEEDADEDDDGETGEDEQVVAVNGDFEDEEDEEEDNDNGYLVQPVGRVNPDAGRVQIDAGSIYIDPADEDEDLEMEEDEDDEDGEVQEVLPSSSSHKRKRDEETDSDDDDDDDDDDDNDDDGDEEDDDIVQ